MNFKIAYMLFVQIRYFHCKLKMKICVFIPENAFRIINNKVKSVEELKSEQMGL